MLADIVRVGLAKILRLHKEQDKTNQARIATHNNWT